MGIFNKRETKEFNYQPRFYEKEGKGSPFSIKHKFDEERKTIHSPSGIKGRLVSALDELKTPQETKVSKRLFYIILVLIFIFLYIIDFDLSIFYK
jgi:hypothetical protein